MKPEEPRSSLRGASRPTSIGDAKKALNASNASSMEGVFCLFHADFRNTYRHELLVSLTRA